LSKFVLSKHGKDAIFNEDAVFKEETMRTSFQTIGVLAVLIGLLWIGQGTGVISWPQSSFMIRQIQWAGYGAVLATLGLVLIWLGRRS